MDLSKQFQETASKLGFIPKVGGEEVGTFHNPPNGYQLFMRFQGSGTNRGKVSVSLYPRFSPELTKRAESAFQGTGSHYIPDWLPYDVKDKRPFEPIYMSPSKFEDPAKAAKEIEKRLLSVALPAMEMATNRLLGSIKAAEAKTSRARDVALALRLPLDREGKVVGGILDSSNFSVEVLHDGTLRLKVDLHEQDGDLSKLCEEIRELRDWYGKR